MLRRCFSREEGTAEARQVFVAMAVPNDFILRGAPLEDIALLPSLSDYLVSRLKEHKDTIIHVDAKTRKTCTAKSVLAHSELLAKLLQKLNVAPGETLAICTENSLVYSTIFLAALRIGMVCAPVNPNYTPDELSHVLGLTQPRVIFFSSRSKAAVSKVVASLKRTPLLVASVEGGDFQKLLVRGSRCPRLRPHEVSDPKEEVVLVLTSSGTTGMPKGVMLTHANMLACLYTSKHPDFAFPQTENPTTVCLMPFFHAMGLYNLIKGLEDAVRLIIMARFEIELFLKTIQDFQIRVVGVPPPVVSLLAHHPSVDKYDLSSLMLLRCGAAPLPLEQQRLVERRLPSVVGVRQGYGLTEATLAVTMAPLGCDIDGTSGVVIPGVRVKIVAPGGDNRPLGPGQEGEICVSGATIMKGYVGDANATKDCIDADGWLHTGDVAYYDNQGHLFVVDRIKELIKYKGFQVAPAELEAILVQHPGVADAAVVGVPDPDAGELPKAFVVRKDQTSPKEILDFVAERVSPQKRLRGGIEFVDEIPRNPSGKILRRKLRERIKSKL